MIARERRPGINPLGLILRINNYVGMHPDAVFSMFAAAYGVTYDGPWGRPGDSIVAFGDTVLEHMISEGADLDEVAAVGRPCLDALLERIPKQSAVTEAVGNSSKAEGSTSA